MEDYLSHHGILGQKWGQQNGPPYPLRDGARSALEKAKSLGKKAHDSYKSYKIKKQRKKSLEKARQVKAENKAKADKEQKKTEKKEKQRERFDKFVKTSNDAAQLANAFDNYAKLYNTATKYINPFLSKKMPTLGVDNKTEKMIDDLIKNGDAQGIWANRTKFNDQQLQSAVKRINSYNVLEGFVANKKNS